MAKKKVSAAAAKGKAKAAERAKKKAVAAEEKRQSKLAQKYKAYRYKPVRSTQNFVPVKEIANGIVITKDGRYVKILEVFPINFLLKSPKEQDDIVFSFSALFKIAPRNIQFTTIATRADIGKHLKILEKEMKTEENPKCKEMQADFANTLRTVGAYDGVTHRFFISFEYEKGFMQRAPGLSEVTASLNGTAENIKSILRSCGNDVVDVTNENEHLEEILYSFLNRRKREYCPYDAQVYSVAERYMRELGVTEPSKLPFIPLAEFVAPHDIDFSETKYGVIDKKYYTFLYLPSNGFPVEVAPGWLADIINAGEGVDVSLFFERQDTEAVRKGVAKSIQEKRIVAEETHDRQQSHDKLYSTLNSSYYIKDALAGGQECFMMNALITVCSGSLAELEDKVDTVKTILDVKDIGVKRLSMEQEQGFVSSLPLCKLDSGIFEKSKRNVMTMGAAATYPFLSYEICDPDGLYLGLSRVNGTLVMPDIFDRKKYANANMFICGRTGAGKTFTLLTLATRARLKHIPVYIIAPVKGEEFRRFCLQLGGQYIQFGPGSPNRINVLDIRKVDNEADKLLYEDYSEMETSRLALKIQDLKVFFNLLVKDMTLEEKQVLDDILVAAYRKKGITMDNDSLVEPETGNYKEMPILGDVWDLLDENPVTKRIANIIKMLVKGSASSFNGQTNVNLDNPLTVLDLTPLKSNEELLPPGMFMAIDFAMSKVKENATTKKMVMFDEWWMFTLNDYAAKYSMEIARIIRAYGGSAVFATQQLSDTRSGGDYGKAVLNACKTKIILGLEVDEAEYVMDALRLTESEAKELTRISVGTALLVANNNNLMISIKASQKETDLFATDRETRSRIVREKRKRIEREQQMKDYKDSASNKGAPAEPVALHTSGDVIDIIEYEETPSKTVNADDVEIVIDDDLVIEDVEPTTTDIDEADDIVVLEDETALAVPTLEVEKSEPYEIVVEDNAEIEVEELDDTSITIEEAPTIPENEPTEKSSDALLDELLRSVLGER